MLEVEQCTVGASVAFFASSCLRLEIWTLLLRVHRTWQSLVQCRGCTLEKCARWMLQSLNLPRAVCAWKAGHCCSEPVVSGSTWSASGRASCCSHLKSDHRCYEFVSGSHFFSAQVLHAAGHATSWMPMPRPSFFGHLCQTQGRGVALTPGVGLSGVWPHVQFS